MEQKKYSNTLCFILGVIVATHSVQVHAESWDKSLAVGFHLTDGNSETSLLNIDFKAEYKKGENEFLTQAGFSYGETTDQTTDKDETTTEKASAILQFNRLFTSRWYGSLKADGTYDAIADVDYRVIVGPSIGHYLLKDERNTLALETGGSYLTDKVGGKTNDAFAFRAAERFNHNFSQTAKLWQSVEYLPEIDDFNTYLVKAEAGAEASLNAKLSLRLVVADTYDSEPAPDRDENDISITTALVYQL